MTDPLLALVYIVEDLVGQQVGIWKDPGQRADLLARLEQLRADIAADRTTTAP